MKADSEKTGLFRLYMPANMCMCCCALFHESTLSLLPARL